jgi:hypothetical protein
MADTADAARAIVRDLYAKRARGDLTEKRFQAQLAAAATALARAVVQERLESGESILAESHVVHAHIKLAESVLAEPEQQTVSMFATQRRLVRVRGSVVPGREVSCDATDGTTIDELNLAQIEQLLLCRDLRWGEAIAGSVIMLVTWFGRSLLQVTGPILMLLGLAGILHGLLLPTRSLRVIAAGDAPADPFVLYGLRRKDTRSLIAVIRRAIAARNATLADTRSRA